jgi:hypothetical protein
MAMKEQQRQVYRTARGKEIDMTKLVQQNELTLAVGNAGVNARGDKIGPGGQIIKRREEIQTANTIPDQISVRQNTAPVKDISDQDPEGLE